MAAGDKVRYRSNTMYGGAVYVTERTAAHLDWTRERLQADDPSTDLVIIQGAFNTTVSASAGTHDFAACLDTYIPGWPFSEAQTFLRAHGWAAWWRYPPSFGHHIHMISLGYVGRVGVYVPGQVSDYYNHRTGLSGHYSDNSWHPKDINSTIFDYDAYRAGKLEDDMPTVDDILNAKLGGKATVREALSAALDTQRALATMRDNVAERDAELARTLDQVLAESRDDATKAQLVKVRAKLVERFGEKDTSPPEKR